MLEVGSIVLVRGASGTWRGIIVGDCGMGHYLVSAEMGQAQPGNTADMIPSSDMRLVCEPALDFTSRYALLSRLCVLASKGGAS